MLVRPDEVEITADSAGNLEEFLDGLSLAEEPAADSPVVIDGPFPH
jgi:hypothetical protein